MCPRGSSSPLVIPVSFPGLSYPVFKGIMKKGYKVPTPIQRKVWGFVWGVLTWVGRRDGQPSPPGWPLDIHPSSQLSHLSAPLILAEAP